MNGNASTPADDLIVIAGLQRQYRIGDRAVPVLKGVDLRVHRGEFVALMGPSGSGKSTLLNVIGLLDGYDAGSYHLNNRDITRLSDQELAQLRARSIGFVFQQFNLIPQLSIWENVALPLFYLGGSSRNRRQQAGLALERVGLAHRLNHRPLQLSGGEMQRAAIARSLIANPPLLVADEPTGNLDSNTGTEILGLFQQLHADGLSLVLVTHDAGIAARADRVLHLRDGEIVEDQSAPEPGDIGGTMNVSLNEPKLEQVSTSKNATTRPSNGFSANVVHGGEQVATKKRTTAGNKRPDTTRVLTATHPLRVSALIGMAFSSLLHHKLRALLTTLGIVFGVAAVVSMLAISGGARQEALNSLAGMGLNTIRLQSVEPPKDEQDDENSRWWSAYGIMPEDRDRLAALLPQIEAMVQTRREDYPVWTPSHEAVGHVICTNHAYPNITRLPMTRGRFLHPLDDEHRQSVCILGADIARDLFAYRDPLGQSVFIRQDSIPFQVIGVLDHVDGELPGTGLGAGTFNRAVFLPERAAEYRLGFTLSSELTHIADLIIQFDNDADILDAAELIRRSLSRHHEISDWEITVPAELLRQKEATSRIFAIVMGSIAGISLLVGGIGIMNIMLATVLERTREIGIRRAVGARRSDIIKQFLVETVVLSLMGGLLGATLGVGGAALVSTAAGWPTQVTTASLVLSLGISALIGLIFGLYPAWRAARLKPVEALRSA